MLIQVTQRHIAAGTACMPYSCAVALAIADALPGCEPEVLRNAITIRRSDGNFQSVDLPYPVVQFIRAFDDGAEVVPFEFDLAI
jgi:hypothetical protein